MTFPFLEVSFVRIQRRAESTAILARLYRVDDGGLDADGRRQYVRTLLRVVARVIPATLTRRMVIALMRERLEEEAAERGITLPPDRLICTLA